MLCHCVCDCAMVEGVVNVQFLIGATRTSNNPSDIRRHTCPSVRDISVVDAVLHNDIVITRIRMPSNPSKVQAITATACIPTESDTRHVHTVLNDAGSIVCIAIPNDRSCISMIRTTVRTCDGAGRVEDDILDS